MSDKIRQVFYSFTFYDTVERKRKKANCNTYKGALTYRNEVLLNKRYSAVSDIFPDTCDI